MRETITGVDSDVSFKEPAVLRMRALASSGDLRTLVVIGQDALQQGQVSSELCTRLIGALVDLRRLVDAEAILEGLPPEMKHDPSVRLQQARLFYNQQKYDRCYQVASELVASGEVSSAALGMVLVSLSEIGQFDLAFSTVVAASGDALKCDWALQKLFVDFGRRRGLSNSHEEALARIGSSRVIDDDAFVARLLRLMGAYKEADEALRLLLLRNSFNQAARLERGLLFRDSNRLAEGRDLIYALSSEISAGSPDIRVIKQTCAMLSVMDRNYNNDGYQFAKDYCVPDSLLEIVFSRTRMPALACTTGKVALIGATMAAGGAERVLGNAFLGLQKSSERRTELWLHSVDAGRRHNFFLEELGISSSEFPWFVLSAGRSEVPDVMEWIPYGVGARAHAIYSKILEAKPNVVHGWQDETNIGVAIAGLMAGVPRIVLHPHNLRADSVHETKLASSFRRAYRCILQREEVHLVCCSRAALDDYLDWLAISGSERFHVVYNGFDWSRQIARGATPDIWKSEMRRELGIPLSGLVVGGVFRFVELKRPLLWLDVARQVLKWRQDVMFVLCGDGPELNAAKVHASRLEIEHAVVFAGEVENAAEKMAAFDVLLHVSKSEGLPTVLLEAQAAMVPVVAFDVGGVRETLVGTHNVCVSEDTVAEYVKSVVCLLSTPPSVYDREVAAAEVISRFSVEKMCSELEMIYQR